MEVTINEDRYCEGCAVRVPLAQARYAPGTGYLCERCWQQAWAALDRFIALTRGSSE